MKYLLAILLCVVVACTTPRVRDETLLPAVQSAWVGVRADVVRGIEDSQLEPTLEMTLLDDVATLDRLIGQGLVAAADPALWAVLGPYGYAGIRDRVEDLEVSPLVAPSLEERMRLFGEALSAWRSP